MSAATGIDSLLDPFSRCLDAESARRIVNLRPDACVQDRIETLAEYANEGTLNRAERDEFEGLIKLHLDRTSQ